MTWMRSRSTSSWVLVRDCAGTPPESPTKSSTLRPPIAPLCSFRYCTSARSMSIPPEASGPVFTVIRPTRIGPAWAFTPRDSPREETPAAWMKRLRVNRMACLLQFLEELLVGDYPAEAAGDVLQAEHVQVVAVHAGDAIGKHDDPVVEIERGERGVQHAGVGVDAHQHQVLHLQRLEQLAQVGAVEAVEALLVVDHVVAVPVELRDDLGARRALDVVLAHRALAPGREAIGLALCRVHRLPERRGHALAADAFDFSVPEHYVDHRDG